MDTHIQYNPEEGKEHGSWVRPLSIDYIRQNKHKLNWKDISSKYILTDEFIIEFYELIDCKKVSNYKNISEDFIRENEGILDWYTVCRTKKLSEDFILEFSSKLIWGLITIYQILSEKFIRENFDKLDLRVLYSKQELSQQFIIDFADKLDFAYLIENKKLHTYSKDLQDKILISFMDLMQAQKRNVMPALYDSLTVYMQEKYTKHSFLL